MDELTGIFKNPWNDNKSYLLCALIYSTGMRNNEISSLRVKDIIRKDNADYGSIDFLNIERSKTVNGIRKIPLHHKVKDALNLWIDEQQLLENDFLFISNEDQRFYRYAKKANIALGAILGKEPDELDAQNISFYSGRHFYKTMLNSYNLGDVEELFMGHSVNRKVSELYNHKDKRGEQELLKAARNAIDIIDKCLFQ
jgi:integrase